MKCWIEGSNRQMGIRFERLRRQWMPLSKDQAAMRYGDVMACGGTRRIWGADEYEYVCFFSFRFILFYTFLLMWRGVFYAAMLHSLHVTPLNQPCRYCYYVYINGTWVHMWYARVFALWNRYVRSERASEFWGSGYWDSILVRFWCDLCKCQSADFL